MKTPSVSRSRRPAAFTLIELLTVIAIIGILAAIIIPTVSKVRQTARNSQCVAKLRDWGRAMQLYANDNKGSYQIQNWLSAASNPYLPYLPAIRDSGGTQRINAFATCSMITSTDSYISYGMIWPSKDGNIDTFDGGGSVQVSKMRNPSNFLMMVDSMSGSSVRIRSRQSDLDEYIAPLFGSAIINPATRGDETIANRHGGRKINGVFGDGSVKTITGSPLGSGDSQSIHEMRTVWFQLY